MAALTLAQHIAKLREALLLYKSADKGFRDGYTGDTENTSNPNSVSLTSVLENATYAVLRRTKFNQTNQIITLAANTREYNLPTGTISIESVHLSNKRLRRTTIQEQDHQFYNWRVDTGTPKRYYQLGATRIGVIPNPTAIGTLNLVAVTSVTPMAASTDTISGLPDPFQPLIWMQGAIFVAESDTGNPRMTARLAAITRDFNQLLAEWDALMMQNMETGEDSPLRVPKVALQAQTYDAQSVDGGSTNGG